MTAAAVQPEVILKTDVFPVVITHVLHAFILGLTSEFSLNEKW